MINETLYYYSAFHKGQEFLKSEGYPLKENGAHDHVYKTIRNGFADEVSRKTISKFLSLKELRENADYEEDLHDPSHIQDAFKLYKEFVDFIDNLTQAEKDSAREGIENYLRVNRLIS